MTEPPSQLENHAPSLVRNFTGTKGKVTAVGFTPSMKQLVSTATDGSMMLWNFKPQLRSYTLGKHTESAMCLAVAENGELFASGSRDHSVKLWEPSVRGGKTRTMKLHSGGIRALQFSKDARVLMSASEDKTIKLWGIGNQSRKFLWCIQGHHNWVTGAMFDPSCHKIASCSDDKTVRLWDVNQRIMLNVFKDHTAEVKSVHFHPGGNCIAAGGQDRAINIWDVRSGQTIQHYNAHNDTVNSVAFHPSGKFMVSASNDSTIRVWDVREGRLLYTLHAHTGPVNHCAFSPDGKFFASGSDDGMVLAWETRLGVPVLQTAATTETKQTAVKGRRSNTVTKDQRTTSNVATTTTRRSTADRRVLAGNPSLASFGNIHNNPAANPSVLGVPVRATRPSSTPTTTATARTSSPTKTTATRRAKASKPRPPAPQLPADFVHGVGQLAPAFTSDGLFETVRNRQARARRAHHPQTQSQSGGKVAPPSGAVNEAYVKSIQLLEARLRMNEDAVAAMKAKLAQAE